MGKVQEVDEYWEIDLKRRFDLVLRSLAVKCSDVEVHLPLLEARSLIFTCYPEGQHHDEFSAKRLLHVAVMLGHLGFANHLQKREKEVDL